MQCRFAGLALDEGTWDHSVFSKNRDRLVAHEVVEASFAQVMALAMPGSVPGSHAKTVGADKACDTSHFIAAFRKRKVTPRVRCAGGSWAILL